MTDVAQAVSLLGKPRVLLPYRPVLLLSHMRANTSILGHILGDHPEIDGYYELHIGYHSWKSLWRQKIRFALSNPVKPSARYLFDKVLHDDHGVNMAMLKRGKILFSLRPPHRTIPSIINLYRSTNPGHPCSESDGATEYFVKRLATLCRLAERSPIPYLYLDADVLRSETDRALLELTKFLELKSPLQATYQRKVLTGAQGAGDSSELIHLGQVQRSTRAYDDITVSDRLMEMAQEAYEEAREHIANRAAGRLLDSPEALS